MPATNPDQTPASPPAPSTASAGSDLPAWLRWLTPQAQRMALWLGVATLGTYAMGSAANHFFTAAPKDRDANVSNSTAVAAGGSQHGMWWNPATDSIETSSAGSGGTTANGTSSSDGNSIIPVDRNAGFGSGSLIVNGDVPIGSNNSRAAYDVLGLGTKSFTASSIGGSLTKNGANTSELHFSLGGDLNLVPVDNAAAGGLGTLALAAVPEPSSAGLLATTLAGLALRRRRKPMAIA